MEHLEHPLSCISPLKPSRQPSVVRDAIVFLSFPHCSSKREHVSKAVDDPAHIAWFTRVADSCLTAVSEERSILRLVILSSRQVQAARLSFRTRAVSKGHAERSGVMAERATSKRQLCADSAIAAGLWELTCSSSLITYFRVVPLYSPLGQRFCRTVTFLRYMHMQVFLSSRISVCSQHQHQHSLRIERPGQRAFSYPLCQQP